MWPAQYHSNFFTQQATAMPSQQDLELNSAGGAEEAGSSISALSVAAALYICYFYIL